MGTSQTSQQPNPEDDMKRVTSPGDSLSANEIEQGATAIRTRPGDDTIFNRISVSQPEKSVALHWQAGRTPRRSALISFRAAKQTHHATYFNAASLYPTETVTSGQPMLTSEGELKRSVAVVNEDESVLAALAKRDVAAGDALCLPRTTGRFFFRIKRIRLKTDCCDWVISLSKARQAWGSCLPALLFLASY